MVGGMGGNITSCMPDTSQDNPRRAAITGVATYVPDRIVTNAELARTLDTSDDWIVTRTGIRERRRGGPGETTSTMGAEAVRRLMAAKGLAPDQVDVLIVATVTPDMFFPATACLIQDQVGLQSTWGFDLSAACSGFLYALTTGAQFVASGVHRRVIVVGADLMSAIIDPLDRTTAVLFGDGAGAVVIEPVERGGFLGFELGADGGGGESLWLPGSGSRHFDDPQSFVKMNGREVYKFATRVLVSSAQKLLDEVGMTVDDVDVYVPHQANIRIIDHAAKKLGFPPKKVVVNVEKYGNTSSGSIPLALADAAKDGRLKPGAKVLMTGMGAGLTWGSSLIEWTEEMAA